MQRLLIPLLLLMLSTLGYAQETTLTATGWRMVNPADSAATGPVTLDAGSYAVFHTTDGEFIVKLFAKETPKTVENFVGLASGRKRWRHPITLAEGNQPLYNNTTIYEVVKDVVVRGGDPIDKGTGDPGFQLDVETAPGVAFDTPGILGMQNSGKKANGSRFFIALTPFPDWTGKYTAFGKVIGGLDVVRDISRKPTKRPSIPLEATLINSIDIVDIPPGKATTASFSHENGIKVITIDSNFTDVAVPAPPPTPAPVEAVTTATAAETTATKDVTTTGPAAAASKP